MNYNNIVPEQQFKNLGSLRKQAESKCIAALTYKPDLDNANVGKYLF